MVIIYLQKEHVRPAFYNVQQPTIISGLSVFLNTGPGVGYNVSLLIQYTNNLGSLYRSKKSYKSL
jgi:hypothetical protein